MQRSCADSEGRAGTPFLIKFLESDEVQRINEAYRKGIMRKPLIWYIP